MFIFPQRVDKALDFAGEDSSQVAKEAVPVDTAEEGKPSSKTQPLSYVLNFSFLCIMLCIIIMVFISCGMGTIVVVIGETTTSPSNLPMGHDKIINQIISMYHQDRT